MASTDWIQAGLLLLVASLSVCTAEGNALRTWELNCGVNTDITLGSVDDNYEGVVEQVSGIPPGTTLLLDSFVFPEHADYLELIYTPGETSATIRTKKALNAKVFHESNGKLYYHYKCGNAKKYHIRKVNVIDINQSPEFPQEFYSVPISEKRPQ